MSGKFIYRVALVMMVLTIRPFWSLGNNSGPHHHFSFAYGSRFVTDSVPKTQQPAEEKKDKTEPEITGDNLIKEVPKARRQVRPVAIPNVITVKPIKIIKPRIIKNTIRILK